MTEPEKRWGIIKRGIAHPPMRLGFDEAEHSLRPDLHWLFEIITLDVVMRPWASLNTEAKQALVYR